MYRKTSDAMNCCLGIVVFSCLGVLLIPDSDDKAKEKRLPPVSLPRLRGRPCRKHVEEGAPPGRALPLVPSYESFHGFRETTLAELQGG